MIRYLRYDKPVQTLVFGSIWLVLMAVGIWLVVTGRSMQRSTGNAGRARIGYGIITVAIMTPVLTGLVWWAFFSEGDA